MSKKDLMEEINMLKAELHKLLDEDPPDSEKILQISERIDELIVSYYCSLK